MTAGRWPGGRSFAFAIVDDTDWATVETTGPVYELLDELGLVATKTVWPLGRTAEGRTGGQTCADPDYLAWVLDLQARGHEIGFHNATDHSSTRAETLAGLDRFRELFGHDPRIGADHLGNREALYSGTARLSGVRRRAYDLGLRALRSPFAEGTDDGWEGHRFSGHLEGSPYFWGDLARERIDYWRMATFQDLDQLVACPPMPYHDPDRPFVRWWYTALHAPTHVHLAAALTPAALDALERRGGACIVYTHFGASATTDGVVDEGAARALRDVARRDGWFAPTSAVLDEIRRQRGHDDPITAAARRRMEHRWIRQHVPARAGALVRASRRGWPRSDHLGEQRK